MAEDSAALDDKARFGIVNQVAWITGNSPDNQRAHMSTEGLVNRALEADPKTVAEQESWAVALDTRTADIQQGIVGFQGRSDRVSRGL